MRAKLTNRHLSTSGGKNPWLAVAVFTAFVLFVIVLAWVRA